jgi:DNA-binding PadR family transcriptional regulator
MERIAALTEGVLNVNPNTMYPLLRNLEERGLIEGSWEHPDRRSRRYYAITDAGAAEYQSLLEETLPFLGALARSLDGIFGEIYGNG